MKDTDSLVPATETTLFFEEYKPEFYIYIYVHNSYKRTLYCRLIKPLGFI